MEDQRPAPRRCCPSWLAPSTSAPRQTGVNRSALLNAASSRDTLASTLLQTSRRVYPINEIRTANQATSTTIPASTASQRPFFRPPGKATHIANPQPRENKTHRHSSSPVQATTSYVVNQSQVEQRPSTPLHADCRSKEMHLPSSANRPASEHPSMCKTASKPQSQSSKCNEIQPRNIVTRSYFLRKHTKFATPDGSHLHSRSTTVPSSVFDGKEPRPAAKSNAEVLNETNIEPKEKAARLDDQHLEATNISSQGIETENLTQTLNAQGEKHQLEHIAESGGKPEETKGINERAQKTTHKDHDKKNKEIIKLQSVASDSRERIKERQHTAVQSEQVQIANQDDISLANGRQRIGTIHHPRKISMVDIYKGEDASNYEEKKDGMSKFIPRTVANRRYPRDEVPVSLIILAGENKGASMRLVSEPSSEKEMLLHIHRKYKLNPDRTTEASTRLGSEPSSETESLVHIDRKYKQS